MMNLNRALTTANRGKFTTKIANESYPVTGLFLTVILSNLRSECIILSVGFVEGCEDCRLHHLPWYL